MKIETTPRKRKAHWMAWHNDVRYRFMFDPASAMIVVRRHGGRKRRTITTSELMSILEGQKLLPL